MVCPSAKGEDFVVGLYDEYLSRMFRYYVKEFSPMTHVMSCHLGITLYWQVAVHKPQAVGIKSQRHFCSIDSCCTVCASLCVQLASEIDNADALGSCPLRELLGF